VIRILKYALPLAGGAVIRTGKVRRSLAVGFQAGSPVLWVEAEAGDTEELRVWVGVTGDEVPDGLVYVGSAQLTAPSGLLPELPYYVVHVYVMPRPMIGGEPEDSLTRALDAGDALARALPCHRGSNPAQGIDWHWCTVHDAEWLLSRPTCAALGPIQGEPIYEVVDGQAQLRGELPPLDVDDIEGRWAGQWSESDDGQKRAWRDDVARLIDEVRRLRRQQIDPERLARAMYATAFSVAFDHDAVPEIARAVADAYDEDTPA
jgi:hypothetical protein